MQVGLEEDPLRWQPNTQHGRRVWIAIQRNELDRPLRILQSQPLLDRDDFHSGCAPTRSIDRHSFCIEQSLQQGGAG